MYNESVMELFLYPHNMGKMEPADGVGTAGDARVGDEVTISIRVEDGRIADARFQALGCGALIAASSAVTDLAIGRAVDEALAITEREVLDSLGGLPAQKRSAAELAPEALKAAIEDFRRRTRQETADEAPV